MLDKLSIANLGQARSICSKMPTSKYEEQYKLIYSCGNNYYVDSVLQSGVLYFTPDWSDVGWTNST